MNCDVRHDTWCVLLSLDVNEVRSLLPESVQNLYISQT